MSWISSVASAFHDLPVLITNGMKMWVLVMSVYFIFLEVVALSAAAPACREVLSRWYSTYVSGTVTSHAIVLSWAQSISVTL